MKKTLALILALCMVVCLCACGTVTKTSTVTTTTTDADGNTTTTSTTTSSTSDENGTSTTTTTVSYPAGSCGEATLDGESHDVDVSIENATGDEMDGLYVCVTGDTEWGNLLDENQYIADGDTAEDLLMLTYSADAMSFDLGYKGPDGELIEFEPIDISNLSADGFTITFTADGWTAE